VEELFQEHPHISCFPIGADGEAVVLADVEDEVEGEGSGESTEESPAPGVHEGLALDIFQPGEYWTGFVSDWVCVCVCVCVCA
jgi:hypothetical protein